MNLCIVLTNRLFTMVIGGMKAVKGTLPFPPLGFFKSDLLHWSGLKLSSSEWGKTTSPIPCCKNELYSAWAV